MNQPNIDKQEQQKFSALAKDWWDRHGKLKTLHDINPARLDYIKQFCDLKNKKVLDLGCGAGILSESLAKEAATVTGIDIAEQAIEVAREHSSLSQLNIDYQVASIEEFTELNNQQYDIITCLEMLEHVPEPQAVIAHANKVLKPGGWLFLSTINRNLKAYLFAILAAEYILRIIPQSTHEYGKLITPAELSNWVRGCGLTIKNVSGLQYNPLTRQAYLNDDIQVNYLVSCQKENL